MVSKKPNVAFAVGSNETISCLPSSLNAPELISKAGGGKTAKTTLTFDN
jgi:hypothetical protein